MARARKKKAAPARKRTKRTKRGKTRNTTLEKQSGDSWPIGAGVLALVVMLGAAVYAISLNDGARTTVANFVERFEVPQSVKELPDTVKRNMPTAE